jgi:Serine hydrolase (FSH1)
LDKLGFDVVFPTAPHKITAADVTTIEREKFLAAAEVEEDWQFWGWAFANEEKQEMVGLDKSLEFIGNIIETQVIRRREDLTLGSFCGCYWFLTRRRCFCGPCIGVGEWEYTDFVSPYQSSPSQIPHGRRRVPNEVSALQPTVSDQHA